MTVISAALNVLEGQLKLSNLGSVEKEWNMLSCQLGLRLWEKGTNGWLEDIKILQYGEDDESLKRMWTCTVVLFISPRLLIDM